MRGNKNAYLRIIAKELADKLTHFPSVLEIAITGSVAGNDPYPSDLDIALLLDGYGDVENIARCARQMSNKTNDWDFFLFNKDCQYIGRLCHRKECLSSSVECYVDGCGKIPHIKIIGDFKYDEYVFLSSPLDVIFTKQGDSLLLSRRNRIGITKIKQYSVVDDIEIECKICEKVFTLTGEEQKWYQSHGLYLPKRCPECLDKERAEGLRSW